MKHLEKPYITFLSLARSLLLGMLMAATGYMAPALAQTAPHKSALVLQVSDGGALKWNLALNNAKNVQSELGANNVAIEIVAYGPGIEMLRFETPIGELITAATQAGIKIVACENTMKNLKLTRADMYPDIGYVPAGVVELMKRQAEGWAYVRP